MDDFKKNIQNRCRRNTIAIVYYCRTLPRSVEYQIFTRQLIRSSSSVGANYRAACRAKSRPDFINKLHIVEEECDESIFWLTLLEDIQGKPDPKLNEIRNDLEGILAIIIKALITMRRQTHDNLA